MPEVAFWRRPAKRSTHNLLFLRRYDTSMSDSTVHYREIGTFAICGAELAPGETHPEEVSEETEGIVNCPKCWAIAVAPPDIDHKAGSFLL